MWILGGLVANALKEAPPTWGILGVSLLSLDYLRTQ